MQCSEEGPSNAQGVGPPMPRGGPLQCRGEGLSRSQGRAPPGPREGPLQSPGEGPLQRPGNSPSRAPRGGPLQSPGEGPTNAQGSVPSEPIRVLGSNEAVVGFWSVLGGSGPDSTEDGIINFYTPDPLWGRRICSIPLLVSLSVPSSSIYPFSPSFLL